MSRRISSENTEIVDLIERTFHTLGGRATKQDVLVEIRTQLPDHLSEYLIGHGLGTKIGQYFRSIGTDGLPQAPEADEEGTHVQLELLVESEYRYVIAHQMQASANARARAQQYADLCADRLGVVIDIDEPIAQAGAA
jgi:hypothetical protein